jgi:hypothetical protein
MDLAGFGYRSRFVVKKNAGSGGVVIFKLAGFHTPEESKQEKSGNTNAGNQKNQDDTHENFYLKSV